MYVSIKFEWVVSFPMSKMGVIGSTSYQVQLIELMCEKFPSSDCNGSFLLNGKGDDSLTQNGNS